MIENGSWRRFDGSRVCPGWYQTSPRVPRGAFWGGVVFMELMRFWGAVAETQGRHGAPCFLSRVTLGPLGTSYALGTLVPIRRNVVAGLRNMTRTAPILALFLVASFSGMAAAALALNPYESKADP